nr:hypothetical protein CFP56_35681 [Quercus suber]
MVADSKKGERSPRRRNAKGRDSKETNGHREGEGSSIRRKANGRREEGMHMIAGKSKDRQFEGMRRVAGKSKGRRCDLEASSLSMAGTNAGRFDHTHPGPVDDSVLMLQPIHRSEVIWKGQDPESLTCRARSEEFSNREAMVDDRVVHIIKALGLEGLLWIPGREIDHGL